MILLNKLLNLWSREKGSQLVEFAIVLPVILILILGTIQLGWVLHQQMQIDNVCRRGARFGAVGMSSDDIIGKMQSECVFILNAEDITIIVYDPDNNDIGDSGDRTPGNTIEVSVDIISQSVIQVMPLNIGLHSSSRFLIE